MIKTNLNKKKLIYKPSTNVDFIQFPRTSVLLECSRRYDYC